MSVPLPGQPLPRPFLPGLRLAIGCLGLGLFIALAAPNPLAAVRGTYAGLFAESNNGTASSAGAFTFTTTAQGGLSGVWQVGGERLTVSGRCDSAGHLTKTLPRLHQPPLTVTLNLNLTPGSTQVTGSVSDGVWTAALTGYRAVFDGRRHVAPQAGRYTVMMPGNCAASNAPCGDSYGTLSVTRGGAVHVSGVLADGTRFTQAARVSANGQWPLYAPLYGRQGWLWSWLTFTNPPAGDLGGQLSWFKPPVNQARYYPGGFALTTAARGSAFMPARNAARLLGCTNLALVLSGGALAQELSFSGSLKAGNQVRLGDKSSLSISVSTGTFRGSAPAPATGQPIPFGGVVLQRGGLGCGSFLGPERSGRVRLSTASATGYVAQFQTLGQSFAPTVENDRAFGETFYWTWSDGTVSVDYPDAAKDFGFAQPRQQALTVYPPGAALAINLGFDGADGGENTPLAAQPQQNVGAVYFPTPLPGLRYWASSYNLITNTLDFTGFNSLEIIECYRCSGLQHAVLANLPALRRACVEACALQELDLSGNPNLGDVRAALNQFTSITVGGGTGPKIWHWCTRDNPQLTQHFQEIHRNFYSLKECYMWNDNQGGALSFVSTNLVDLDAHSNHYTSADLSGQSHLSWCRLYDNQLTDVVVSGCESLQVLDLHQNQLPTPVLDRLLEVLDATAPNLRQVDLTGNAGPASSAAYPHYQNLLNRGVSVRVDF